MAIYIYDYDEITIRVIKNGITTDVPKFRITMVVDEPFLYLYWTDTEKGDGGEQRVIEMNYTDVEADYSGAIDTPTSAEDLYGVINLIIRSALGGSGGGSVVSVDDDGNGVVTVDNSDPDNPVIGFGGVFTDGVTMAGDGTAGSPLVSLGSGGSVGTELTPELFADGNVTGIGANQFLDDLGYTDGTAAVAWPLTDANYPGGISAAGMTLDFICWQEMFYYAEANGASYMTTSISFVTDDVNRTYYVNKTLYLPRIQSLASNKTSLMFIIDFRGAWVRNSSGSDMVLFDRYPTDQTDADTLVGYKYCFWNGRLRGNGGTTEADTIIRLGASSFTELKSLNMEHAGVLADLQFCLEPSVEKVNVSDYGLYGVAVRNGQWSGAGFFNAQSNIFNCNQFRSYNSPGGTPSATILCEGNHTLSLNSLTFEGDVGCDHHFWYDNDGAAGTNISELSNLYFEFAGCTRAGIRFRAGKGQFVIRNPRSSVVISDMPVLIEGDNDRTPTSVLEIILENNAHSPLISKLRAVGDPNYPVKWKSKWFKPIDNSQFNIAANFETGVIANSYVPNDEDIIFLSADGQGSGVFVDEVTITGQGTEADPFQTSTSLLMAYATLN